ncbi:EpsG family protein [Candidatus Saccharibacteria bacterium]|nr:EpsG family protein [Candidatus Saccharibacteria bacterium]
MTIITLLTFLLCPLLALPLVLICSKKDIKHQKFYLLLISLFVALFAYGYHPSSTEDLYRHQENLSKYQNYTFDDSIKTMQTKPEQLTLLYEILISKLNNPGLLQFFTTKICYFLIFYLLSEYSKRYPGISKAKTIGVWLFVLSGFHFFVIVSNIFYTLALEVFSLGVYVDYEKKKKISWLLYIISPLIHTSAILPLILIIFYKIFKSKISAKSVLVLTIAILLISTILPILSNLFSLPIINEVNSLYRSYFYNEDHWARLHSVSILILYLSRLAPVILSMHDNRRAVAGIGGFATFTLIAVILLFFQTSFSIRYIHIVVLCGIPTLFEALSSTRQSSVVCLSLYLFAIPHVIYQIRTFTYLNNFDNPLEIVTRDILTILETKI